MVIATRSWCLADAPVGFDSSDANFYRYAGNNPTNATDPSGLAEIKVMYPWKKASKEEMLIVSAAIDDGKTLTIKVQEGKDFEEKAKPYPFFQVMGESPNKDDDTDSAQAAVRWTGKGGKDVGHVTNAKPVVVVGKPPRSGKNAATEWKREKEKQGEQSA